MPRDINTPDPRRAYQQGRILDALKDEALTARKLADRLHLSLSGITWHLAAMKSQTPRMVRIAGYAPSPTRQRSAPMYGLGAHPDAVCVRTRAPKGRITVAERHAQILALLEDRPRTAKDVVHQMGLQRARIYIFNLQAAGQVYIKGWKQGAAGGYPAPVYAVGDLPDLPRPAASTQYEKNARHWARLKADPHRHGLLLQRNRMRKKPQTWLSALMG